MKQTIHLNENDLKNLIRETISEMGEVNEFDNVPNDFVEKLNGQYYEVYVPDWCLPYLVNGTTENYTDEEIEMMQQFEREYNGKLWHGLQVGDACVPMDGASPNFYGKNDVGGGAAECYKFCLPTREAEAQSLNENFDSLYTDDEGYAEAIDFDAMQNIFKQFGISTIGSREVENPQTGETGIRYEIDGENINKEELENALKSAANNPDGIIVSLGRHRNAPEITRWSVVVLDY